MEINQSQFEIELTLGDIEVVRALLIAHGHNDTESDRFNGAQLHRYFEAWLNFVETDWSDWDCAEYSHDIGCRYWIQLAIENSEPGTRDRLETTVDTIDALFKKQMRPAKNTLPSGRLPLRGASYFWETHTIHPDLALP